MGEELVGSRLLAITAVLSVDIGPTFLGKRLYLK